MKIAICMYYTENISNYAYYSREINKMYCKKYGYDLIMSNETFLTDLTPHYERYPLLLRHIDNYDWIVWIDSDAYFYIDSPPLENIIKYINYSHTCILSYTITQYLSSEFKKYYINNGIFLMKNTEENKEFLYKMIHNKDIIHVSEQLHHIYDQSVFRFLYDTNYRNFKDNSYVLNYGVLQHFYDYELPYLKYKPYIHHLAGNDSETREKIIKKYYIKIKYFNWKNILIFVTASTSISLYYYFN